MIDFLKTLRTLSLIFLAGGATGAYGEYRHGTEHVMSLALKGNCVQPDVDNQPRWFACADYYIATELQRRDAERDAEVTAVLSDMAKHEPKAKTVRAKTQ